MKAASVAALAVASAPLGFGFCSVAALLVASASAFTAASTLAVVAASVAAFLVASASAFATASTLAMVAVVRCLALACRFGFVAALAVASAVAWLVGLDNSNGA